MPIGALAVRVADLLKVRRGAPIYYDNGKGLQMAKIDAIVPGKEGVDKFEILLLDPKKPDAIQVIPVTAKGGVIDKLSLHPQTLSNGVAGLWKKMSSGMAANKSARMALKYLTEGFIPQNRNVANAPPAIIPQGEGA